MDEYGRLIFLGLLFCGIVPYVSVIVFCLLTGRLPWLFSKDNDAENEVKDPGTLKFLVRLSVYSIPVYIVLLGLTAYLGLL